MNHQISLNVDGVAATDLYQSLKKDDSLLEKDIKLFPPVRYRGDNTTDSKVTIALITGGILTLNTLITSLTNIYIAKPPAQATNLEANPNKIVVVIEGDQGVAELEIPQDQQISEENLQAELDKIGSLKEISVTPKN